ncbi:MAG: sulfite exporter TauE/SafE family protein [Herbaspirillum sp.]
MMWEIAYLGLGAFTGILAGLMGVGGGMIMVPILTTLLQQQGIDAVHSLHLALGTSMATILVTSVSSLYAHHCRQGVIWPLVGQLTPGVIVGAFIGTRIAVSLPARVLTLFFTAMVVIVAIQMLTGTGASVRPKPGRELPGVAGIVLVGTGIGAVSTLVAIGGGVITVPFLSWCNVRIQNAIGTSAAVGFPIALGGTLGYVINGWHVSTLPANTFGFVYVPAWSWMVLASVFGARIGAALAYRLSARTVKRIFAVILIAIAVKLLLSSFWTG